MEKKGLYRKGETIYLKDTIHEIKDPQVRLWRRWSFLVSIIIHIFFLLVSTHFFNPIGELFHEEEVRAVFLAESPELYIPDSYDGSNRLRNSTTITEDEALTNTEYNPDTIQDLSSISKGEVEQYLSGLHSKTDEPEQLKSLPEPEILGRFRLDKTNETNFSLVISPESFEKKEQGLKKEPSSSGPQDRLYSFYAVTDQKLAQILASHGSADVTLLPENESPVGRSGIVLNRWAEQALEKIERYWLIDPVLHPDVKGTVGISVTVAKNGEVSDVEIIESSGNIGLDQSALNAIKMSNPLPSLPGAFPQTRLVISIEFEYDD